MASLALFVRMIVALGVVLGLVLVASRLLLRSRGGWRGAGAGGRRSRASAPTRGPGSGWLGSIGLAAGAQSPLSVVARRSLGRHCALLVVQAGRRYLLLAATAQSVQLLAELSPGDLLEPAPGGELELHETATPGASPIGSPWTVQPGEHRSLPAWDAFLTSLRERTVRR